MQFIAENKGVSPFISHADLGSQDPFRHVRRKAVIHFLIGFPPRDVVHCRSRNPEPRFPPPCILRRVQDSGQLKWCISKFVARARFDSVIQAHNSSVIGPAIVSSKRLYMHLCERGASIHPCSAPYRVRRALIELLYNSPLSQDPTRTTLTSPWGWKLF